MEKLEEVQCPLCGGEKCRPVMRARDTWRNSVDVFHVVRCTSCDMVYTNPRPSAGAMASYYDDAYPFYRRSRNVSVPDAGEIERRIRPFVGRAARLAAVGGAPGTLLDVGCGDGYFLTAVKRCGWSACGIERDAAAAAHARALGHDVLAGSIDELSPPSTAFDAVSMWGVLQLSPDPSGTLARVAKLLRPGGILAIGVSNFASLDRRLLRGKWWGLGLPRHLCHFEEKTLRALLEKNGFHTLHVIMDAPRWVAFETANTVLQVGSAPGLPVRILRRSVVDVLRAIYLLTRRTGTAPVMEVYAAAPGHRG